MTEARMFPVLHNEQIYRGLNLPDYIRWEYIELHRKQVERNHGQTLERVAERGGLSPKEIWCAMHNSNLMPLLRKQLTEEQAVNFINLVAAGEHLNMPPGVNEVNIAITGIRETLYKVEIRSTTKDGLQNALRKQLYELSVADFPKAWEQIGTYIQKEILEAWNRAEKSTQSST